MKEIRFFYVPDTEASSELPDEEAMHASRVLRLSCGDNIFITDGKGYFYEATISEINKKHCFYNINNKIPQQPLHKGWLHIAVAPTKSIERIEWFIEKATEIGIDEISILNTKFTERKNVRIERLEKIAVSAMKQSHKAWKPLINEMTNFNDFILKDYKARKFICHCYDKDTDNNDFKFVKLKETLSQGDSVLVLIGPEGDFSIDEVMAALGKGFQSLSLGESRLRTETAALVAVHLMNLFTE